MQRQLLNLHVPSGTETLLVKSDYRPDFRAIIALTLSFVIVQLFVKGHLIYSQVSQAATLDHEVVSFVIRSVVGDTFGTFMQFLSWALGIALVKNSSLLLKIMVPAIFFAIGGVISTILFESFLYLSASTSEKFEILRFLSASSLVANILVVIFAKMLGFTRNKIAPYVISLMIFAFLYRLYLPEIEVFATSTFSKMRIDYFLLHLVVSMIVLRLLHIPFYDDKPESQSPLKHLKSLIAMKLSKTDVIRKEAFEEVTSSHPGVKRETIAKIFTTIPYADDLRDTKLKNVVVIFVILLSCFSNYGMANWNQFGYWLVIVKLLLIYFLLQPTPYVYIVLLSVQLIAFALIAFELIELLRHSSVYSYYGMDKFQKLLRWTTIKLVATIAFVLLLWNVFRFRYPNFRLFKAATDGEGNLLL